MPLFCPTQRDQKVAHTSHHQIRRCRDMFRRKKTELEDVKPIMETNDELGLSGKPATRPGAGIGSGKAPVLPTQPPRATEAVRPGIEMPRQTPTAAAPIT